MSEHPGKFGPPSYHTNWCLGYPMRRARRPSTHGATIRLGCWVRESTREFGLGTVRRYLYELSQEDKQNLTPKELVAFSIYGGFMVEV